MERLQGLAAEVLALPNLTAHQRLVWATSLRLDAVPVQERRQAGQTVRLQRLFWMRGIMFTHPISDPMLLAVCLGKSGVDLARSCPRGSGSARTSPAGRQACGNVMACFELQAWQQQSGHIQSI